MDEGHSTTLIMGGELLEKPIGDSTISLLDINVDGTGPFEKPVPNPSISHETEETDDDGRPKRRGTVWTASATVIASMLGSGLLALPWSIAQMGWIAGPLVLWSIAVSTSFTSLLLADTYRFKDPVLGKRLYTYVNAVNSYLGSFPGKICAWTQNAAFIGCGISYIITASNSMVALRRSQCILGNMQGCKYLSPTLYIGIFGLMEIFFSQIRDFGQVWWISIISISMSICYSLISIGFACAIAIGNKQSHGNLTGIPIGRGPGEVALERKIWSILSALGNMAFAYDFNQMIPFIQDTLKSPPAENKTMKKATLIGVSCATFIYTVASCVGYAAFGNNTPGDFLSSLSGYKPAWLVDIGNLCVIIQLSAGYQIFTQPFFAIFETWAMKRWPRSQMFQANHTIQLPFWGACSFSIFRLTWRTAYVCLQTFIAMLVPFFNDVVGLLGAICFWPLAIYLPVEMYIKQASIATLTGHWWSLQFFSCLTLFLSIGAAAGSVEGLIRHGRHGGKPFKL
ncbi:unnamed protein product [Calypogeia fissa]